MRTTCCKCGCEETLHPNGYCADCDTTPANTETNLVRRFYNLPAYWATSLINGDNSGLNPDEEKQIESFLKREGLKKGACADCSREAWFSHSNDATSLGGDVLRYTFLLFK